MHGVWKSYWMGFWQQRKISWKRVGKLQQWTLIRVASAGRTWEGRKEGQLQRQDIPIIVPLFSLQLPMCQQPSIAQPVWLWGPVWVRRLCPVPKVQVDVIKEDFGSLEVNQTSMVSGAGKPDIWVDPKRSWHSWDTGIRGDWIFLWCPKTSMCLPILFCSIGNINSALEVKGCTSVTGCRLMSGLFTIGPMWVNEICPYQSLTQPRKIENGATWLPISVGRFEFLLLLLLLPLLVLFSWRVCPRSQDTPFDGEPLTAERELADEQVETWRTVFLWMCLTFIIKFLLWFVYAPRLQVEF